MIRKQAWAAAFLLAVGMIAAFEASKLPLGVIGRPGAGFFPFYLALALTVISAALLVQFLWEKPPVQPAETVEPLNRARPTLVLLAMLGYAFILEPLGFVLSTFLLMLVLFKAAEPRSWLSAVTRSLAIATLAYLLFRLLEVQIPMAPRIL